MSHWQQAWGERTKATWLHVNAPTRTHQGTLTKTQSNGNLIQPWPQTFCPRRNSIQRGRNVQAALKVCHHQRFLQALLHTHLFRQTHMHIYTCMHSQVHTQAFETVSDSPHLHHFQVNKWEREVWLRDKTPCHWSASLCHLSTGGGGLAMAKRLISSVLIIVTWIETWTQRQDSNTSCVRV